MFDERRASCDERSVLFDTRPALLDEWRASYDERYGLLDYFDVRLDERFSLAIQPGQQRRRLRDGGKQNYVLRTFHASRFTWIVDGHTQCDSGAH